jgi:YggT family protein
MENFTRMAVFLITTLSSLYITIVMLRFLFQLARADFYNPLSQFIVKATNPLLRPLRHVIPGVFGIDTASIVLALLLQILAIEVIYIIQYGQFPSFMAVLVTSGFKLIALVLEIYFWALLIMVILSWVAPGNNNPVASLIDSLLHPLLVRIRKIIPSIGGLDFSPMVAMFFIYCIKILLGLG